MNNTCEAIGTHACVVAATLGYFVFAAAVLFIALALMRGILDLTFAWGRFRASKRATLFGSGIAASAAATCRAPSPARAVSDRVLAFAPKTRNRAVLR